MTSSLSFVVAGLLNERRVLAAATMEQRVREAQALADAAAAERREAAAAAREAELRARDARLHHHGQDPRPGLLEQRLACHRASGGCGQQAQHLDQARLHAGAVAAAEQLVAFWPDLPFADAERSQSVAVVRAGAFVSQCLSRDQKKER